MSPGPERGDPLAGLELPGCGECHLWWARLDLQDATVDRLSRLLSDEERERAARFHFERHRRRAVAVRAFRRIVLGRYLGVPPGEVACVVGERGKPRLDPGANAAPVEFNLSHSGERALLGVTVRAAVGVDVERIRPMPDALRIAGRHFAPGERRALDEVDEHARAEAFLRCWTRKEAYVKAIGDGLHVPLDRFAVGLGVPARFLHLDGRDPAGRWRLQHVEPEDGYVGAVALEVALEGPAADDPATGPEPTVRELDLATVLP